MIIYIFYDKTINMGRRLIDNSKKLEVAALLKHNPNLSQVTSMANVSRCFVRGIKQKVREYLPLINRPSQGRPRLSSVVDDRQLVRLSKTQRTLSSRGLSQQWSEMIGKRASARTVRRRLFDNGMKSYVQKRKPHKRRDKS